MGMLHSVYSAIFGGEGPDNGVPDPATGLTPREKSAIRDSWAIIAEKKKVRDNGVEFFVMLFEEYPYMQSSFNSFKGLTSATLRKDRTMYSHALTVMYSIGSLVDNLDDPDQLVLIVTKMANNHLARDVGLRYFEDLRDMFPRFLVARAGAAATPFMQQSWSKFLALMNSVIKQQEEQLQQAS